MCAAPARAQSAEARPTAALVERVLAAVPPARTAGRAFGPLADAVDQAQAPGVADSVRARLRTLPEPTLRAALDVLERPEQIRLTERATRQPTLQQIVAAAYPAEFGAPKKASLADSVLAARYADATGRLGSGLALAERLLRTAAATLPAAQADLRARGLSADSAVAQALRQTRASAGPLLAASARIELAGAPGADVRARIAFETSEAGRALRAAVVEGEMRALVPPLIARIAASIPDEPSPPPSFPETPRSKPRG